MPIGIMEWKRTSGQYIAILQALDRFDANTIREIEKRRFETVLGGTLKGTDVTDWYALAYDRRELEFDEARTMARETLLRYQQPQRY